MGAEVMIKGKDGDFMAYMALPPSGHGPAVVVIQEIFGVNAVMRAITDALAEQGFVAICPDLFWRIEPGVSITDQSEAEWKKAFELYSKFNVDKGVEDIQHTIDFARSVRTPADSRAAVKVGVIGFCLGGLLTYLAAARTDCDAASSYYGVGIEKFLSEAGAIRAPTLLHIATADKFVPAEAQAAIKARFAGDARVTVHLYEGQDHAFARKGGEHYDAPSEKLAGDRTLALLREALA